jgi:hypothetical protein
MKDVWILEEINIRRWDVVWCFEEFLSLVRLLILRMSNASDHFPIKEIRLIILEDPSIASLLPATGGGLFFGCLWVLVVALNTGRRFQPDVACLLCSSSRTAPFVLTIIAIGFGFELGSTLP